MPSCEPLMKVDKIVSFRFVYPSVWLCTILKETQLITYTGSTLLILGLIM